MATRAARRSDADDRTPWRRHGDSSRRSTARRLSRVAHRSSGALGESRAGSDAACLEVERFLRAPLLRRSARESPLSRPGATQSPAVGRPSAGDSLGQQRRTPAPGARGAARGRAICADLAGLFARLDRLQRAQARLHAALTRTGVRRRSGAIRAGPLGCVLAGCEGRRGRAWALERRRHVSLADAIVRGSALDRADERGRSSARRNRPGRHREDSVHVWIDRDAERRHQHAPNALQQPAGNPSDAAMPGRRTAGARRLAAVASHVWRQPQHRHRGLQRRIALSR